MGRFLDTLRKNDRAYRLQASDDGYMLTRIEGREDDFNALARDLIDHAGTEFAVFPTSDGHTGYERVFVIPF